MVSVTSAMPLTADGAVDTAAWCERITLVHQRLDQQRLLQAAQWLTGYGEDMLPQSLELAEMVAELRLDQPAVLAAMAYAGYRKGMFDEKVLVQSYGADAAKLCVSVAALATSSLLEVSDTRMLAGEENRQVENIKRMLVSLIQDFRVAVIKLAERVQALRYAKHYDEARQQRIAEEAASVFAPLANRMGMWQLKWELEDLSLRYLREDIYLGIAKQLKRRRQEREQQVKELVGVIQQRLQQAGIQAKVKGRAKNIFSIWRKMQSKGIALEDVHDVRAVRIVVDDLANCYAALGIIHSTWSHVPSEFDDYIAVPKENGYQSIHTAITFDDGRSLEVQIRTHAMHDNAELGVCAHWAYKEGDKEGGKEGSEENDPSGYAEKMGWLRQVMDWHETLDGIESLPELLAQRVSEDRIYVSTPKGHVLDMAAGATVLDLAYRIHTELGHTCTGGYVNGEWAPIRTPLKTGEQVEIISGGPVRPHRAWLEPRLGYMRTHRAKASVAAFFRSDSQMKSTRRGRSILQNVVAGVGASPLSDEAFNHLSQLQGYTDADAFFVAVALGQESYISLANRMLTEPGLADALQLWSQSDDGVAQTFPARCGFRITAKNRESLLRDITSLLADQGLPIAKASGEVLEEDLALIKVEVTISDWLACLELLSHLSYLRGVVQVVRYAV
ncbi:MAG: HD domain-containing protein [Proteobacteria bacterium]|nr:HD domain-containing protein [Pseudomonadota bacterium]